MRGQLLILSCEDNDSEIGGQNPSKVEQEWYMQLAQELLMVTWQNEPLRVLIHHRLLIK